MKTRREIKAIVKKGFSDNYWKRVGVFFILSMILTCGISFVLIGPIVAGISVFSVKSYRGEDVSFNIEFTARKIGGGLWKGLFEFLWLLLFIIPGIIKGYSYALTYYILGMCPDVKARDALKLSMRIMKGHKWELFVFQLSYIGWFLLSLFTIGLVDVFYASPYYEVALGGFYDELVNNALETGVVTQDELDDKVAA